MTTGALLNSEPADRTSPADASTSYGRVTRARLSARPGPMREPFVTSVLKKLFFWRQPTRQGTPARSIVDDVPVAPAEVHADIQRIELKEEMVSTRTVSRRTASARTDSVEADVAEGESHALVGQGLDDVIYAALVDHTRQLKREIGEQLTSHAAEVESRMLEHVESVCQTARESHETVLGALGGLRDEFAEFRQNVIIRFGNIEKIGNGLDESLGKINTTTEELTAHCRTQTKHFEGQLTVTRESLDSLRQTGEKRVRDLGAHYQEKESLMRAEQEKRHLENERIQRSYSERLRGFSTQLEQLATRLQATAGQSELPPLDDFSTGRRLWRWAMAPYRKMQRRQEAERRLAELHESLRIDHKEILGVRNHLQTFSREVHHAKAAGGSSGNGSSSTRTVGRIAAVSRSEDIRKVS